MHQNPSSPFQHEARSTFGLASLLDYIHVHVQAQYYVHMLDRKPKRERKASNSLPFILAIFIARNIQLYLP